MGRGGGVRGGDGGLAGLRLQRVVVGLLLRLWTSLRPCRLSSSTLRCTRGWCLRSISLTSASTSCLWWRILTVHTVHYRGDPTGAVLGAYVPLLFIDWCRVVTVLITVKVPQLQYFVQVDDVPVVHVVVGVSSSWTRLLTCPFLCMSCLSAENCEGFTVAVLCQGGRCLPRAVHRCFGRPCDHAATLSFRQ